MHGRGGRRRRARRSTALPRAGRRAVRRRRPRQPRSSNRGHPGFTLVRGPAVVRHGQTIPAPRPTGPRIQSRQRPKAVGRKQSTRPQLGHSARPNLLMRSVNFAPFVPVVSPTRLIASDGEGHASRSRDHPGKCGHQPRQHDPRARLPASARAGHLGGRGRAGPRSCFAAANRRSSSRPPEHSSCDNRRRDARRLLAPSLAVQVDAQSSERLTKGWSDGRYLDRMLPTAPGRPISRATPRYIGDRPRSFAGSVRASREGGLSSDPPLAYRPHGTIPPCRTACRQRPSAPGRRPRSDSRARCLVQQDRFSGTDRSRLAACREGDLAFVDVEQLIVGEMTMRWRAATNANEAVKREHRTSGLLTGDQERVQVSGAPERPARAAGDVNHSGRWQRAPLLLSLV